VTSTETTTAAQTSAAETWPPRLAACSATRFQILAGRLPSTSAASRPDLAASGCLVSLFVRCEQDLVAAFADTLIAADHLMPSCLNSRRGPGPSGLYADFYREPYALWPPFLSSRRRPRGAKRVLRARGWRQRARQTGWVCGLAAVPRSWAALAAARRSPPRPAPGRRGERRPAYAVLGGGQARLLRKVAARRCRSKL
jgi:hypothetical protein